MIATITDLCDRKTTEKERQNPESRISRTPMMEIISNLSGGIAHQFNNALTAISGNIELLEMSLSNGKETDKYVLRMKSIIVNMTQLTEQLLAYGRGGKYQPRTLSLSEVVKQSLPLLTHPKNPEIRMETVFEDNVPNISADFAQIRLILSAVITNAMEAITHSGLIRISTKGETVTPEAAQTHPGLTPGDYAGLTIEDDGAGMDEVSRSRIFEPFFTTKFQGRGLGMAAVYGIVKNHRGWIGVDSESGKGTTVHILFPKEKALWEKETTQSLKILKGEGNILVIEDEAAVMDVNRAMLEALGYRVIGVQTGREAVQTIGSFEDRIDLVLLDMGLPDMKEEELVRTINSIRPNTRVIVCTGGGMDGDVRRIVDAGVHGFLEKPYTIATLSVTLKKALGFSVF